MNSTKSGKSRLKWLFWSVTLVMIVATAFSACVSHQTTPTETGNPPQEAEMVLSVTSPAFEEGQAIPDNYTCEGQNISPPIYWSQVPAGTESLALILEDPNAPSGTFTHWVIFNIPADSTSLPEAVPTQETLASGAVQGNNSFSKVGYGGPCPPSGSPHHYRFTVYALDKVLNLKPGASKDQLLDVMVGNILGQGQLIGTYQR